VTAKHDNETAFLVEVSQAGIFTVKGIEEQELGPVLGNYCPATLFPYARQQVSELVTHGGFPQLLLAPVNFDALYAAHVRRQRDNAQGAEGGNADADRKTP
jgi:preprotein translocase subunit SecB